ncbi:unnamed protein product, partial [Gordionus sp. m RMFG-2023]
MYLASGDSEEDYVHSHNSEESENLEDSLLTCAIYVIGITVSLGDHMFLGFTNIEKLNFLRNYKIINLISSRSPRDITVLLSQRKGILINDKLLSYERLTMEIQQLSYLEIGDPRQKLIRNLQKQLHLYNQLSAVTFLALSFIVESTNHHLLEQNTDDSNLFNGENNNSMHGYSSMKFLIDSISDIQNHVPQIIRPDHISNALHRLEILLYLTRKQQNFKDHMEFESRNLKINSDKYEAKITTKKSFKIKNNKSCREMYEGLGKGYPFFDKGFYLVDCPHLQNLEKYISIVILIPHSKKFTKQSTLTNHLWKMAHSLLFPGTDLSFSKIHSRTTNLLNIKKIINSPKTENNNIANFELEHDIYIISTTPHSRDSKGLIKYNNIKTDNTMINVNYNYKNISGKKIKFSNNSIINHQETISLLEHPYNTSKDIWIQIREIVKTPYILIAKNAITLSATPNISRLLFEMIKTNWDVLGGAVKLTNGSWYMNCYQSKLADYHWSLTPGYRTSHGECLHCDYMEGPLLIKSTILSTPAKQTAENNYDAGNSLIEDLFMNLLLKKTFKTGICPDSLFVIENPPWLSLSSLLPYEINLSRYYWPMMYKWNLEKISFGRSLEYTVNIPCKIYPSIGDYLRSHESFILQKWKGKCFKIDRDKLLSPCCRARFLEMLTFVFETCRTYDIDCELQEGTLLGAVKLGNILPWDRDGDITFLSSHFAKLSALYGVFKNAGYELLESGKPWCCADKEYLAGGKFLVQGHGMHIEMFGHHRLSYFKNIPQSYDDNDKIVNERYFRKSTKLNKMKITNLNTENINYSSTLGEKRRPKDLYSNYLIKPLHTIKNIYNVTTSKQSSIESINNHIKDISIQSTRILKSFNNPIYYAGYFSLETQRCYIMVGNVWLPAPSNPGLHVRNRYGKSVYKHSSHWMNSEMINGWQSYKHFKFERCYPDHHSCLDK